jgi:hypothetical protein
MDFVAFTATSSGVRNGVVRVQDDAPGGTQMVSLTGTGSQSHYAGGAAGEISTSGDAIPFGAAANLKLSALGQKFGDECRPRSRGLPAGLLLGQSLHEVSEVLTRASS